MPLPLIPILIAGGVVLAAVFAGKKGTATHALGNTGDTGFGYTVAQADAVAPVGAGGYRVFTEAAKIELWKQLGLVSATLDTDQGGVSAYRLQDAHDPTIPHNAQAVALTASMTQGRYVMMPIVDALGGAVPFMRTVIAGGLPTVAEAPYAILALPGEAAALAVKAGSPGPEVTPPPGWTPIPIPGGAGVDPGVFGIAPGALLPGDPYGVLAALGATPALDALGTAGAHYKRQLANALDPALFRDLAAVFDGAGNAAAAAELRRGADLIQALHDATATAAQWPGLKSLESPYIGRALNLIGPLDYAGLRDESLPFCPGVRLVDLAAMEAASGYPRPAWAVGDDAGYLAWLLALTTPIDPFDPASTGTLIFPGGPIYATVPNPLCPDVAQITTFRNSLQAAGKVGPWLDELDGIASRLGRDHFGTY